MNSRARVNLSVLDVMELQASAEHPEGKRPVWNIHAGLMEVHIMNRLASSLSKATMAIASRFSYVATHILPVLENNRPSKLAPR